VPALPAAALKHDLILEKLRLNRLQPAEKLIEIFRIFLCKMRPLPAEILRRLRLVRLDLPKIGKTRNSAHDLILAVALLARQHALNDLFVVVLTSVRQQNVPTTRRAGEQS